MTGSTPDGVQRRVVLLSQPLRLVGARGLAARLRQHCGVGAMDADGLLDSVLAGAQPGARSTARDREVCLSLLATSVMTAIGAYRPPVLVVAITATNRYAVEALAHELRARGVEVGHVDVAVSEPALLDRARRSWGDNTLVDARRALRASGELRPDHILDATAAQPDEQALALADVLAGWGWLTHTETPAAPSAGGRPGAERPRRRPRLGSDRAGGSRAPGRVGPHRSFASRWLRRLMARPDRQAHPDCLGTGRDEDALTLQAACRACDPVTTDGTRRPVAALGARDPGGAARCVLRSGLAVAITPGGERTYWIEVYGGGEVERLSVDEALHAPRGALPCRTTLLVDIAVAMRLRDHLRAADHRPLTVPEGQCT